MAAGLPNNSPASEKTDADETETPRRANYKRFLAIPTRWMDNDVYGHVNNVVYYSYFDTVVNEYLITEGGLEIGKSPVIGLVVETRCRYFKPIAFPETVEAGLRVGKLGNSSVRYEIAIFRQGDPEPAAAGHFVHVYVDRVTRRPVPVPDPMRLALSRILAS
jgi:acyl-CoA thioester hydrolase